MRRPLLATISIGCCAIVLVVGGTVISLDVAYCQSTAHTTSSSQADTANYKLRVHSNLVFLPTRVQTKQGEPIYGLTADRFIVEDNGVPQSVKVDEDPSSEGLSLVVAVQCGRSAPREFGKIRGLGAMIDEMSGSGKHEIAVLAYGEKPYVLDDFSPDPDAVRLALSKLRPCGDYHAVAIDTVYYAINMLNRRQNNYRRAILLISELRDYGSRATIEEVVAQLGVTNTVIYSVAFSPTAEEFIRTVHDDSPPDTPLFPTPPSSHDPKPNSESSSPADTEPLYTEHPPALLLPPSWQALINAFKRNAASELANLSGGEYITFASQRGFEAGLQRVSNQVHDYYVLSFKPSSDAPMSLHTLRVSVPSYPDAVIQTRRSYLSGMADSPIGDSR